MKIGGHTYKQQKLKEQKKQEEKTIVKKETRLCIDCKHSSWETKNFLNRDIFGKPTLLVCPFINDHRMTKKQECECGNFERK